MAHRTNHPGFSVEHDGVKVQLSGAELHDAEFERFIHEQGGFATAPNVALYLDALRTLHDRPQRAIEDLKELNREYRAASEKFLKDASAILDHISAIEAALQEAQHGRNQHLFPTEVSSYVLRRLHRQKPDATPEPRESNLIEVLRRM